MRVLIPYTFLKAHTECRTQREEGCHKGARGGGPPQTGRVLRVWTNIEPSYTPEKQRRIIMRIRVYIK